MDKNKIENELIRLAKKAYNKKEIPVSALIIKDNKIISKAYNKKNLNNNPIFHAEVLCIFKACKKLKRWNLNDCILYVTLEPCDMCKEIIQEARIKTVNYYLKKGNITNKYAQTQYEQMYVNNNTMIMENYIKNFFINLRK